jgi:hypothetical protein
MHPLLIIGLVLLSLIVAGIVWGFKRIKKRQADVDSLILSVSIEQVPELAQECVSVFSEKLGKTLTSDNSEAAALILDEALSARDQMNSIAAFERPDHWGWFVLPMGAFLGELIKRHANARWIPAEGGGLAMEIGEGQDTITIHPFDKINKQRWNGDKGDLLAYVKISINGPSFMQGVIPMNP